MVSPASPADPKAFLGKGWAFPPSVPVTGTPAMTAYEEDIQQSIRIILGTDPGERVMRPGFGAGLNRFVFEPVNPTTMTQMRTRVREALVDWEARIDVLDVNVFTDNDERNRLNIEVHYRVRANNALFNFVYPFYLDEGTAR